MSLRNIYTYTKFINYRMVFLLFVFSKEFEHTKLALREFRQRKVIGASESREITGKKDNISSAVLSKVNHIFLLLFYYITYDCLAIFLFSLSL